MDCSQYKANLHAKIGGIRRRCVRFGQYFWERTPSVPIGWEAGRAPETCGVCGRGSEGEYSCHCRELCPGGPYRNVRYPGSVGSRLAAQYGGKQVKHNKTLCIQRHYCFISHRLCLP